MRGSDDKRIARQQTPMNGDSRLPRGHAGFEKSCLGEAAAVDYHWPSAPSQGSVLSGKHPCSLYESRSILFCLTTMTSCPSHPGWEISDPD